MEFNFNIKRSACNNVRRSFTAILFLSTAFSAWGQKEKAPITPKSSDKTPEELKWRPTENKIPIDMALQKEALAEIKAALASPEPELRAKAIDYERQTLKQHSSDDIIKALLDTDAHVRFTAVMAAGDLKLAAAKETILRLVDDDDRQVRIAVRYTLHKLGDYRYSHDLEKMAVDSDMQVRCTTAMVLGRLNIPSAVKLLKPLQSDSEPAVRLQAIRALAMMGDKRAREALKGNSVSAYPDDVIFAVLAMADTKDELLLPFIYDQLNLHEHIEVRLAAARALGEAGFDIGYNVAVPATKDKDPQRRFLAAMALGAIGRTDTQEPLAVLLREKLPSEPSEAAKAQQVKLAAAYAILKLGMQ